LESDQATQIADKIAKLDDVLGVEIVAREGKVLARASAKLNLGPEWLEINGALPSMAWGLIARVEPLFGEAQIVIVEYENAKLVGFKVGREGLGAIVAISPSADPYSVEAKVLETVRW
jgi:hypothetical protein